ncbi:WD40/YVTN/BNR-like repeat-containing protein [Geomonas azotofigens]|uniref:WD40/YVTN/BNR-like repeat-containing protein n=1 Tax=Geomonas azotofigens TaxID=2843196 RepID=UPI001C123FCB|nr:YCF48-related protein [Geomonas azotofigens]MBU5613837.1 glycosyl hydrolase [Geomonas azotofigens]
MFQQGIKVVTLIAAVLSAAAAFADCTMDTLVNLEVPAESELRADAPFMDVLDTPAVITPLASRTPLNGITRAGKRLVAAGARGHIVYSDDEGRSWKQAKVPVSSDLTAVHFPTSGKGWAVGHDGVILHSADGGASWVKQFDGRIAGQVLAAWYRDAGATGLGAEIANLVKQGPDKPFLDVWFDDETTGYAVGAFNFIFRTYNGGASWEPWLERTENPKRLHLYAIRRTPDGLFVAGEQGLLLKFDSRRGVFAALDSGYNGTFFGLTGKAGVIVAFGLRGNAYRSVDGGKNWRKVETGAPTTLTGGTVTRGGDILLVTLLGGVLASHDDGATFGALPGQQGIPAAGIAETQGGALALVGMRGVRVQAAK